MHLSTVDLENFGVKKLLKSHTYGVPFVPKFSDKKFTYLLLKMSKNQAICKSRTAIY